MKLIIDIPENYYKDLMSLKLKDSEHLSYEMEIIKNGTPLTEVVAKIKALDTDCHVVYAVAIDDVSQILEEYRKGEPDEMDR